jgi:hypothetical protein
VCHGLDQNAVSAPWFRPTVLPSPHGTQQTSARAADVCRAIRELDDVGREAFIRSLTETGSGTPDDWLLTARDAQLPPIGDGSVRLFLGAGKSRSLSAAVRGRVQSVADLTPPNNIKDNPKPSLASTCPSRPGTLK